MPGLVKQPYQSCAAMMMPDSVGGWQMPCVIFTHMYMHILLLYLSKVFTTVNAICAKLHHAR